MKKVVDINLDGKKFTIDEDAYLELDKYLTTINKHFSTSTGFEDIIEDIETRIAELFEEKNKTQVISLPLVKEIQTIMGTPEDFGAAPQEQDSSAHVVGKRLFRNPEDKVLGGVISGLAAYLGTENNVTLLRFIVFLMIMSGIGFFVYLLLWALLPEATTASDRLAMRGEDININSIAKSVEDGVNELKETVEDLHKNIKQKFSS